MATLLVERRVLGGGLSCVDLSASGVLPPSPPGRELVAVRLREGEDRERQLFSLSGAAREKWLGF